MATIAGRHPDTILAAVARGEFPKPLRKLGGRYQWARDVIDAYFAGADIRTATDVPAPRVAATR